MVIQLRNNLLQVQQSYNQKDITAMIKLTIEKLEWLILT